MKNIKYIILSGLIVIGCAKEKGDSQVDVPAQISTGNTITLTPQQIEAINLEIGHMDKHNLSNTIQANGYLDVPPQNKAVISPMITGFVRKVNFLVGDEVKKGLIMAELESMEFIDLQQKYIELKSQLVFLEDDYNRQKLLRDQDAVSRKKYLMAEVEYNTAVTIMNGIKSKLSLLGLNLDNLAQGEIQSRFALRAPISGSVNKLEVAIGQHVNPSEEIYEIVNIDHLHLELNVFEKDVIKVKKGQKVRFQVSGIDKQEFTGKVFLVGNDLSEDKRSINVHVHLDDEEGPFTVGMYANATIATSDHQTYTLPATALVIEEEQEYVFKKVSSSTEGMTFRKVPVRTGIEASGLVELADMHELIQEDEIVIKGAFYLLNAFSGGENEE
jgi:cobalt-zinc-cadmium efflux system membrane fusion protein